MPPPTARTGGTASSFLLLALSWEFELARGGVQRRRPWGEGGARIYGDGEKLAEQRGVVLLPCWWGFLLSFWSLVVLFSLH
jgi:hypothetical protein